MKHYDGSTAPEMGGDIDAIAREAREHGDEELYRLAMLALGASLWWTSADGQQSMDMGDDTEEQALATLLDQCTDDEDRRDIRSGTFGWAQ